MTLSNNNNNSNNNPVYKLGFRKEKEQGNKNQKTRLCKNISNCAFGERCHYAHKLEDLKIGECAFGEDCIFVLNNSCGYENKINTKLCYFRHPNESDNDYNIRIGNTIISTPTEKIVCEYPPRLVKEDKHSPIAPIKLSFDEDETTNWKTVGSKKTPEDVHITLPNSEVLNEMQKMIDKGVRRVYLTITY